MLWSWVGNVGKQQLAVCYLDGPAVVFKPAYRERLPGADRPRGEEGRI